MTAHTGKNILLGISGGIAAYKAAQLTRLLRAAGHEVRVVMTPAAGAFVTPLTFQALSGNPVSTSLLDPAAEAGMGHIELARWADLIVVAPATADIMARVAHGMADDLLTTLLLASAAPVAMVPAMNQQMWANAATQDNASLLASRNIRLWGPAEGPQACGDTGAGRMLEPEQIMQQVTAFFHVPNIRGALLSSLKVILTAGPTREAIDPVRYISNHSSGKMGYALAQACTDAGAEVVLVSGPVSLPAPDVNRLIKVETAAEMLAAVMQEVEQGADIFIATAAVADYRVEDPAGQKIKKADEQMTVQLVKNPDILGHVASLPRPPFTLGFAAETHGHDEYAQEKLVRKNLDMLAMNDVADPSIGFQSDENAMKVFFSPALQQSPELLPKAAKTEISRQLVSLLAGAFQRKTGRTE